MKLKYAALGSIATITSGGTPDRKNSAYWNGNIPWIKTAQIQNKTIEIADIDEWITPLALKESAVRMVAKGAILMAMYGQGRTRGQVAVLGVDATVNQACAVIKLEDGVDRDYVFQQLLYRYDMIRGLSNTGSQENLNAELIREIAFPVPLIKEQRKIASLLACWDTASDNIERLVRAKSEVLAYMREYFISENVAPSRKIRSVTKEIVRRNGGRLSRDAVMAVTKERGLRPMREETISANLDRYKVVSPDSFAYNPMRLNIGSIAMSLLEQEALVSPDYVVFECDELKLLPGYLNHARFTRHWVKYFGAAGSGSVRVRIYYDDLAAFSMAIPSLDEQRRILEFLDATANEISVLNRYASALRQQKRGLMMKLLDG
ncbi:restriction endonuclease subunit S [Lysobacter enzymogenes]|uniref:restriction endonuclease subunit S n=1 Tax=Lysobacter enzymogenes TaxID=69 RepID=UPI003747DD46